MKKILPGLFKYHLIPIAISLGVVYLLNFLVISFYKPDKTPERIVLSGIASGERGSFADFYNKQTEIELIGSLSDKKKLTIFGSSELQGELYSSYFFLPDSIGLPTIAFGHEHHQNLSIACELLAAGDKLEGANVCVILSPGWFETEGTNIEAFLEFVRPNFLRRIIHDPSIPLSNKLRVADFVRDFYSDINNPSVELTYLKNMSLYGRYSWLPGKFNDLPLDLIPHVEYEITSGPKTLKPTERKFFSWAASKKRMETEFLKTCRNNSAYVDSAYYVENLLKDGKHKRGRMIPASSEREFEDFQLVVEILKRHHCKASFILQPLNPYHFRYMYRFTETQKKIKQEVAKAGFSILDMYVIDKSRYVPGTLKDVMHPGNRGWMEMNEFLVKQYRNMYE
ncbi:D-alanyl-lipoteichoic acid biosynthesis protein DltD [uncultured Fluviicola sp.]|uniref:D-alanyl-lipoteichoic acid biosynthesis protein DltD n=1 Tax=uncultured Fluviicola sp. TaxID=463303 RepID=UPI0025E7632B|nr:D-alanyl-lipoteichoic acid biosynthesis protein DltD [uncultured Fluviicola sp.]